MPTELGMLRPELAAGLENSGPRQDNLVRYLCLFTVQVTQHFSSGHFCVPLLQGLKNWQAPPILIFPFDPEGFEQTASREGATEWL